MLSKIFKNAPKQTATVPEWLMGCWKREYIFDSDGTMDEYSDGTKVVYMQSPSAYIDFRIPHELAVPSKKLKSIINQQTPKDPFDGFNQDHFNILGSQLCDSGTCSVEMLHDIDDGKGTRKVADMVHQGHNIIALQNSNSVKDFFTFPVAKWTADINYQLDTTYPEPGILTQHESRKDCMYEQPPSNEYLELWHYQGGNDGPCIHLELIKETEIENKDIIIREKGRMIIIGDHWMRVRDRKCDVDIIGTDLKYVMQFVNDIDYSKEILDSEYSYGRILNFNIELSSIPCFVGRRVKIFDDTNWSVVNGNIMLETDEQLGVSRYWELKHFGLNRNEMFNI